MINIIPNLSNNLRIFAKKMNAYSQPQFQSFNIPGIQHISPRDAYEALLSGEALLIDVREELEVITSSVEVENSFWFPMSTIVERYHQIPADRAILVICTHGERSSKIVNLLKVQGFTSVYNIDGGIQAWENEELPMSGSCNSGGCSGCSCGCSC